MKRQFSSVALLVTLFAATHAAARTFNFDSGADALAISPADVLHSAFYLRGSGRDQATSAATPQELRTSIERRRASALK